jgi:hypothetical protein
VEQEGGMKILLLVFFALATHAFSATPTPKPTPDAETVSDTNGSVVRVGSSFFASVPVKQTGISRLLKLKPGTRGTFAVTNTAKAVYVSIEDNGNTMTAIYIKIGGGAQAYRKFNISYAGLTYTPEGKYVKWYGVKGSGPLSVEASK